MRKIITAREVTCATCSAEPGEPCEFWYGTGRRRFKRDWMGFHAERVRDASAVTDAVNALLSET